MRYLVLLILLIPVAARAQWSALKGPPGGAIDDIEIAANGKMYSLANWTVSLSSDNGVSWSQVTNYNVDDFAFDLATKGNIVYGIFYSTIRQSSDDGVTWVAKGQVPSQGKRIITLPIDGGLMVASKTEVSVSVDGGVTWKKLRDLTDSFDEVMDFDAAPNGDVYLSLKSAGLVKFPYPANPASLDNWSPSSWSTVFPPETNDPELNVAVSSTGRVYVIYQNDFAEPVLKSSIDNGATWQSLSKTGLSGNAAFRPRWAISPGGKVFLFTGYREAFEFTEANPTPWAAKAFPGLGDVDLVNCAVWRTNIQLFAGTFAGLFQSSNSGLSYSLSNTGINYGRGQSISMIKVGAEKRLVYTQSGIYGYYYSNDDGLTWNFVSRGHQVAKIIKLSDTALLMCSSANPAAGTFRSSDGINWTASSTPTVFAEFVVVAENDVYGFTDDGKVYSSIDKGANWTLVPTTGMPVGYMMFVGRDTDGFFYTCVNHSSGFHFYKVDSTVDPWVATAMTVPNEFSNGINQRPFSMFVLNNKIYVDQSYNLVSSDKGTTWKRISTGGGKMVPVRQGTGAVAFTGPGFFSITQDDGGTVRTIEVPAAADITQISFDDTGDFAYASADFSSALKYTGKLVVPPSQLPEQIPFNWSDIPSPNGGRIDKTLSTTNAFFALGAGKLYKYNTPNSSWTLAKRNVLDAFVDASNKLYITGNDNIEVSTDEGVTFTTKTGTGAPYQSNIVKTPSGDILLASEQGLYRSTDDATTFTKTANGTAKSLVVAPNGVALAVVTGVLSRSIDNGATWNSVPNMPGGELFNLSMLEGNNFALTTSTDVLKSTDGGLTWTSIKGTLPTIYFGRVFVNPANGQYYNFDALNLYVSTDQGANWTRKGSVYYPRFGAWFGNKLYLAGDGLSVSSDGGATFTQADKGIVNMALYDIETFNGSLYAQANDSRRLYVSNDKGLNWTEPFPRFEGKEGMYQTPDAIIAYGSDVFKSTDGKTFTKMTTAVGRSYYNLTSTPDYGAYFGTSFTANKQVIIRSTDLATWTDVTVTGLPSNLSFSQLAVTSAETILALISVGQDYFVYRIAAGTATKVTAFSKTPRYIKFYNGKIYIATEDALYETSDGLTFTKKFIPFGGRFGITEYGQFVRAGDNGTLWLSRDKGTSWQNVGNGLSTHSFADVAFDEYTGEAYAVFGTENIQKTSALALPDDKTAPTQTSVLPADNAQTIALDTKLTITFNEEAFPVSGKKLKVFTTDGATQIADLDVTSGTTNVRTFTYTLPAPLVYLTGYYVTIDNGAFKDIFGNLFVGITDKAVWNFTTVEAPDTAPPVIAPFTPTDHEVNSGAKSITFNVTDNKAIAAASAKLFYRAITATTAPVSLTTTPNPASPTTTAAFTASLPQEAFGAVGVAYYFEVADVAGNKARSPSADNTFHYSYLTYPTLTPPKLPVQPTGGTTESYRIISLPYDFTDKKVATIFKDLGEKNKEVWRLLTYSGLSSDLWLEYADGDFDSFERGKGYWINIKDVNQPALTGAKVPRNNSSTFFSMELKPGWNQIGNPYTIPISWEETRAQDANIGKLKVYGASGYANGDNMDVHTGGFVFYAGQGLASIKVRFPGFSSGGRTAADDPGSDLASDTWEVPITIRQGDLTGMFSGIGMNPKALQGYDHFDDLNPPPFATILEMNFEHPGSFPRRFAKDIVPTQQAYTWEFNVDAARKDIADLQWDNSAFGNNDFDLYLLDRDRQIIINMKEDASYSFAPAGGSRFKIFFGRGIANTIKPEKLTAGDPYPNPSDSEISLNYALSSEQANYRVKLDVLDVMGRVVATVVDREQTTGFYKVTWDHGTLFKQQGAYIFKLTVSNSINSEVHYRKFILK